ncbi:unnamed protein product [Prunus brigantina]
MGSSIHSLVEITSRKIIKPSSPTPNHLKTLKLSLLDQMFPPTLYGPLLFFYTNHWHGADFASKASKRLQESLSKTLVLFYPLAGRLKGPAFIECNDEGAHLLEARVNCQLADFLQQPEPKLLNHLIPETDSETAQVALGSVILLVQINVFNCGGIAIAVSPSHKIGDVTSLYTFVRTWAAINRDEDQYDDGVGGRLALPEFNGGNLLPSRDLPAIPNNLETPSENLTTRRFVFDVSKMASLKAKIEGIVQNFIPTNVQLVLAIILKCAIAASHNSKPGTPIRPTVLFQMVNLRRRMLPELPQNAMGNWFWPLPILFKEDETQLHELVSTMRKGLTDFVNEKANRFKGVEGFLTLLECIRERGQLLKSKKGINIYRATSLCKLPLYEMDFGWGKPTWVTSEGDYKNVIMLLDTKFCDGIEAWVTLDEQEMAIFESDEELLAYLVPSTPAPTMFDIKSSIKLKSNM